MHYVIRYELSIVLGKIGVDDIVVCGGLGQGLLWIGNRKLIMWHGEEVFRARDICILRCRRQGYGVHVYSRAWRHEVCSG